MKLPNGFGGVHKLSGKRRRPWRARVTAGWQGYKDGLPVPDEQADSFRQVFHTVGYYKTRKEALTALAEYRGEAAPERLTVVQLLDRFDEYKRSALSPGTITTYQKCRKRLAPLFTSYLDTLTADGLDSFFSASTIPEASKALTAGYFKQALRYALKKGWIEKDIAGMLDSITAPAPRIARKLFTASEVADLWNNPSLYASAALVALYGGWRPSEVLSLSRSNVDLKEQTITAGSKTKAGKGRVVPIHSAIRPLIERLCAESNVLFFPFTYESYHRFLKGMGHTPHDTRHTFATAAKNAGMDATIRKRILGHAVTDITESVYTHATAEQYRAELEKVVY